MNTSILSSSLYLFVNGRSISLLLVLEIIIASHYLIASFFLRELGMSDTNRRMYIRASSLSLRNFELLFLNSQILSLVLRVNMVDSTVSEVLKIITIKILETIEKSSQY